MNGIMNNHLTHNSYTVVRSGCSLRLTGTIYHAETKNTSVYEPSIRALPLSFASLLDCAQSPEFQITWKQNVSEIWCFGLQISGGRHLLCWSPYKGLNWISQRAQQSWCLPPLTWRRKQIQFPQRRVFFLFRLRTMGKVKKRIGSECHTPSSEPFWIY
jgi:hypothetical protein